MVFDMDDGIIVKAFVPEVIGLFEVTGSDGETTYTVDIDIEERTCFCNCPDFLFRKQTEKFGGAKLKDKRNHCKHIRKVLEKYEKDWDLWIK